MAIATYSKTGTKATTAAKLDATVFGVAAKNHELVKAAYVTYLANGRENLAVVKTRAMVSGGGKKPWKQKGTGRARFGSSRVPIWRGGGITFGPTGEENYSKQMNVKAKRLAVRQALTMANEAGKIKVVESFTTMENKTKDMVTFLGKIEATGNILCVVATKDATKERATQNIQKLKVVSANYLNVFDILNADTIVFSQDALKAVSEWLGEKK
ncbi:MAG: ribosomal protein [Candidatus Saccharibacteria bacterium]|nr:ribosomal protein [Candidatus Saccharibacteria bacterium]